MPVQIDIPGADTQGRVFLTWTPVQATARLVGGKIVVARHGVDWRTHLDVSSQGMGEIAHPCPLQSIMPTSKSAGNGNAKLPLSQR